MPSLKTPADFAVDPPGFLRRTPLSMLSPIGWLIVVGALLRLPGLFRPLLGNFSSVQCMYGMIARNYLRYDWNPFLPRSDYWMHGAPALRLLDFPWNSIVVAWAHAFFAIPIDAGGRLLSVIASTVAIGVLYRWIKTMADETTALIAAGVLAFSPLAVVYGQSFMADAPALMTALVSLYATTLYLRGGGNAYWNTAWLSMAAALLLKMQVAYLLGILGVLYITDGGFKRIFSFSFAGLILLAVLPAALWVLYCGWLDSHRQDIVMGIFHQLSPQSFAAYSVFSPQFWKRLFCHVAGPALTPLGFGLLVVGLARSRQGTASKVMGAWLALGFASFLLLTRKVLDMNYYVLWIVPPSGFFIALECKRFWESPWVRRGHRRAVSMTLLGLFLAACFVGFAAAPAFKTPIQDRFVPAAGRYVREHVPLGSRIIAKNGNCNNLLYYCNRYGWGFGVRPQEREYPVYLEHDRKFYSPEDYAKLVKGQSDPIFMLEYRRELGAEYLVTVDLEGLRSNPDLFRYLRDRYTVMHEEKGFELYDLRNPRNTVSQT